MQQIVVVVAGITLAGLIGCTRAAELRDQFQMSDYRLPFNERLRVEAAAPVIVLGRVLDVKEIGQPQRSNGDPRIKTQLTRINIDVEEVIKGALRTSPSSSFTSHIPQRTTATSACQDICLMWVSGGSIF